ncbi:MAG: hypothetical protein EAZ65_00295 [Verrucomicrobia bacterium]|nr:MAG: hypothetical protein EAZ84_08895 [Verrucomicrobiota bacterium]TAE89341.1 MAG: hypothetical protein EAZ82_01600 [Verrucomicrobiota bacterium]TAF27783.1 MAG: hypothetical protein EAZ71_00300 [Verrucomicrobiota bacterium]TAF42632.1 MAG: hypothetical protein EAZ65_00295 [Verrucomicrobiota bacterium]
MWKPIIILALIPLLGAWLARHWFWTRIQLQGRRLDCGTCVSDFRQRLGLPPGKRGTATDAASLGNALRECGLALLDNEGDRPAKARLKGAQVARVMPTLLSTIGIFAMVSQRVPSGWAIAGMLLAAAAYTLVRLSGLAIEWRAVARGTEALRETRALKRADDEEEVVRCAKASVWNTVGPF